MATGTWRSDHAHSVLRFEVPYLGIGYVLGVFREHRATLEVGPDGPTSVEIEVTAASVDTNDENRDHLLRSMDFLDVEAHPFIRYRSEDIGSSADGWWRVIGDLAVNGVTHHVTFEVDLRGPVEGPAGHECIAAHARGYVSRAAFGLREPADAETRAQPDADIIEVRASYTLLRRTT